MKNMPEIKGSVSVANETTGFINENVKVPFVAAAKTAQEQVANGIVLGGHLGVVQDISCTHSLWQTLQTRQDIWS